MECYSAVKRIVFMVNLYSKDEMQKNVIEWNTVYFCEDCLFFFLSFCQLMNVFSIKTLIAELLY